jgi:hypothetical protein
MSARNDLELAYLRAMRDWLKEANNLYGLMEPNVPGYSEQKAKAEEAYERYQQAADAFFGGRND